MIAHFVTEKLQCKNKTVIGNYFSFKIFFDDFLLTFPS